MADKLTDNLVESLTEAPEGKTFPVFDGTAYATVPAWTPQSARATIVVDLEPSVIGSTMPVLGDVEDANERLVFLADGTLSFGYADAAGTPRYATSTQTVEAGERVTVVIGIYADRVGLTLKGTTSTSSYGPDISDVALTYLATRFGQSGYFNGTIHSVQFLDHSPLQGARFMPGDGASRYAAIPEIPLVAGDGIRAWAATSNFGANQYLLDDDDSSDRPFLFIEAASRLVRFDAFRLDVNVDGQAVSDNSFAVTSGRHHLFEVSVKQPTELASIGARFSATEPWRGTMASIEVRKAETGQEWQYNNRNDSGNLLINSSTVDRLGAARTEVRGYAEPSTWVSAGTTHTRIGAPGFNRLVLEAADSDIDGQPVEVEFSLEILAGSPSVYLFRQKADDSGNEFIPVSEGYNKIRWKVQAGATAAALYIDGSAGDFRVSNLSWRRIHALATAEGEELVSLDPAAWSEPRLASDIARAGSALRVTADSAATCGAGFSVEGVEAGEHYSYSLSVRRGSCTGTIYSRVSRNLALDLNLLVNESTANPAQPLLSEGVVRADSAGRLVLGVIIAGHQAGEYVEIQSASLKKVTHGLWHQSGSPMTNAAADAARTRLPMISRHYLFDEPGRIKEVLGGGADATLINLDASDWQAE